MAQIRPETPIAPFTFTLSLPAAIGIIAASTVPIVVVVAPVVAPARPPAGRLTPAGRRCNLLFLRLRRLFGLPPAPRRLCCLARLCFLENHRPERAVRRVANSERPLV